MRTAAGGAVRVKDVTRKRVLITGATGFIGCRAAEILSAREGYEVRALVHNPASASRLSRLPVEMVQADVCDVEAMRKAAEGCQAAVHCAIGTTYGDRRRIWQVTVGGTRNVAEAAAAAGVTRFVHLSSVAVYGENVSGTIDEESRFKATKKEHYGQTKIFAERAVEDAARRGLAATILRPGCVYGPFGATFVTNPITALKEGRLVLVDSADTPSNTVYVDNLVEAIVRALEEPPDGPPRRAGEIYNVVDDDGTTWGEYYGFFAAACDAELRHERAEANGRARPARQGAVAGVRSIVTSPEAKQLAKRILNTPTIGRLPKFVLQSSPGVENWLRRRLGSDKATIYRQPQSAGGQPHRIVARPAIISAAKARRKLNYGPMAPRAEALARTLLWLRQFEFV